MSYLLSYLPPTLALHLPPDPRLSFRYATSKHINSSRPREREEDMHTAL
jgi:hypothetical protein